uniref:G-protein coupled receptors family 1 profile domain-containing protein n=1 Tax=Cyprinus carpio carpio TaxID=630221 RepID=A0A8C1CKT9_CYPCA
MFSLQMYCLYKMLFQKCLFFNVGGKIQGILIYLTLIHNISFFSVTMIYYKPKNIFICCFLQMNSTEVSNATSSDCSRVCPIKPQHISISVLICLTFLVGLLLNVFSLWVFTCRTQEWTCNTVLQFHLAVSDVLMCPMGPFMAVYYHTANWLFGKVLCRLKIAFITFHINSSILFLTFISIQRYVAVVRFNQDSYMNRKDFVQKLCFGVWLFVLVKGTVLAAVLDTSTMDNHTLCLSIHQEKYTDFYFIVNFTVLIPGLLLSFVVSAICYTLLVRSMSRLDTSHDSGQAIKSKSCKMVAVCLTIFVVCFTPMNVLRSVGLVVKKFFPCNCGLLLNVETAYYVSWILAGANCCLDPIIYCFSSQKFTKTFRISLRKIGLRLEMSHGESS